MRRDRVCVFLLLCCCSVLLSGAAITEPSDVEALLTVKRSLIDPMDNLKNWNNGDPCTTNWTGVVCSVFDGAVGNLRVKELQLLNMNLSGNLAPEISQLSQLENLNFMWNNLTGLIPKEIGSMRPLKLLLLNGNKFSGSLPDELGNLTNLKRFQIDENQISGHIPKSYANLTHMKHLHFNNNTLSGEIPSELSRLHNLLHLLLDNNNLSGSLPPEFSSLPKLSILQLDNNNLEGEIPASYEEFPTLVKLSLRNCSLEGPIPNFSKIANLSYLDLSWNHFTGPIPPYNLSSNMTTIILSHNQLNGSIPRSFSNLHNLQKLSLESNFLNGSVPALWEKMSFNSSARLTLDLRNNSFSDISGSTNPPANVTLRLGGNPFCQNLNRQNSDLFCTSKIVEDQLHRSSKNSNETCRSCPTDSFFEYVPDTPDPCFCASPLGIGYRLKSPSFSYFPPYIYSFQAYLTKELSLDKQQLLIDSYVWEGSRLRMYLKIFPLFDSGTHVLDQSKVFQITEKFMSWNFTRDDFFGPYELLNFTLPGHHQTVIFQTVKTGIGAGILAAIVVGSITCILMIVTVAILLFTRHSRYHRNLSRKKFSSKIGLKIDGVKAFSFKEMQSATGNFNRSTQVGQGGYGKVYKGILSDNSVVAIKRAEEGSLQGQKEFLTEIELLSRLHHRNLVSLIGYCDEAGEQMLVYEFMPNGTLRDWLSGFEFSAKSRTTVNLNFRMRLQIALGSAKGILYLHTEANPPIFHRDIKARNILLDAKLTAKVADFGLSRLAPDLDFEGDVPGHISTVVKGTPGYLDPEYFLTRKLTDKSDVYSLGVVLLELLTGMHPISYGKNIVREVKLAHQMGTILSIVDTKLGSFASECLGRFVALALSCCHDKPEERPSMLVVVRELENILYMMPDDSGALYSDPSLRSSAGLPSPVSTSSCITRDRFASGSMSGSDLISGVVPTIAPR
ncbi:probable LRR receptor-like serine/threonine-protein kinase At1g06840 isoform X1 [Cucurbita pepo subsp. pepo]|uniref:probable LRR receptor-like serine/threonine-protein kinase At1g06840 isoform X1 n=2 Tax=Cucurbita pepo subsp. pepo TaxID=3664 RepID=UPI000C9D636D|nr:probable LRR receptor-like serine/threonine-protein kinase At1g06840 isoform X1 [Cucurbita pepo subsp. pepo]